MRSQCAFHEAAHVFAAIALGIPLNGLAAAIERKGDDYARTFLDGETVAKAEKARDFETLEKYAVFYAAGFAAEECRLSCSRTDFFNTIADGDRDQAQAVADCLADRLPDWAWYHQRRYDFFEFYLCKARIIVSENLATIQRLAETLDRKGFITEALARSVVASMKVESVA